MKTQILLLSLILTTGCADHLARYYQPVVKPFPGPVAAGNTFVTYVDGMAVYRGLPPVPYYILGRFDRFIKLSRLPEAARFYKADFIFIDERPVDYTVNQPGIMLFNQNMAIQTPGTTHTETRLSGLAYLATTNPPSVK
jgi:hypothetical protein